MTDVQWLFEALLIGLLVATLFHAIRLERALVVLRRDRAAFDALIAGFNDSTRLAEDGAERLRLAADGAGKQISRQIERAGALKEDLVFLTERGEKVADLLERLVVEGRGFTKPTSRPDRVAVPSTSRRDEEVAEGPPRSKAERDLLRALRIGQGA